jgi:cation transporter-like permease
MAALIEWNTVGQIFAESLAAGIVIAATFAFGARQVASATGARDAGRRPTANYAIAGLCFLIAAAAVAYGVYFTIDK